jgi:hypothetical protein
MKAKQLLIPALLVLSILHSALPAAQAQGTAFTYQGRLNTNAVPANGFFDFQFALYPNAAGTGSQVGSTITQTAIGVTNGLFTTTLNFGAVFAGNATWLAISVRNNGIGSYLAMAPLQGLYPAPYAMFATTAGTVSGTVPATQLSGIISLTQLPGALLTNNEGNVTLGNVTINGNLNLPATATINSGGTTLLHDDGNLNFFIGQNAGNLTTSGSENTAVGAEALQFSTNDNQLVAVGYQALQNDDGTNEAGVWTVSGNGENTAIGYQSLTANTYGFANTAVGYQSLSLNTIGEASTALGDGALFSNTTGLCNTAIGYQTMFCNTTGSENTASGLQTLYYNTTGFGNTGTGWGTLFSNMTGSCNTATGWGALWFNVTGNENVAEGFNALEFSTNDSQLVAVGFGALQSDNAVNQGTPSGNGENTAIGYQTLMLESSGAGNTAVGYQALGQNTNGNANTAIGDSALYSSTSGSNNVALGYEAGINITTGNNNIDIGHQGFFSDNNTIRIGTKGTHTACYLAGTVYANGTFVSSSDRNAKENFKSINQREVLEKVAALPVSRWNYKQDATGDHIGPMAQDFYSAFNVGPDNQHITTIDEGGVALAAIQGLNQKLDEKDAEIQALKQSVAELKKTVQLLAEKK